MHVVFKSNRFTYNKSTKTFVAEVSDFQLSFGNNLPTDITIVSTRTGSHVTFHYTGKLREEEDCDGEIVGYEYKSINGYKILLYND